MTDSVHKNLTGADLHEPKGADTALSGQVYVSDGAGSGVWTTASDVIANAAWSTGDVKTTHKITADTGWIMWSDGTIGDGSSGATARANADCADLFALYWNNYLNTWCAVSGGRGVSAAADFAAHKTIGLPKGLGRALALAGTGGGFSNDPGTTLGSTSMTLATTNIPTLVSTGTNTISVTTTNGGIPSGGLLTATLEASGGQSYGLYNSVPLTVGFQNSTGSNSISVSTSGTNATSFSLAQPTTFLNAMIKL